MQRHNRYNFYMDKDYDTLQNFMSYYNQFSIVKKYSLGTILEVGKGNGTLSRYLSDHGYDVKTCDYDKKLKPDIVSDVRKMHIKDGSFDTVLAFEVLEHIPFSDFRKALLELKRVSRKKLIISVPYSTFNIYGRLKIIPFTRPRDFLIRICEMSIFRHTYNGLHYWEMGKKGTTRKEIKKILSDSGLKITHEFSDRQNPYHYFFVMDNLIEKSR